MVKSRLKSQWEEFYSPKETLQKLQASHWKESKTHFEKKLSEDSNNS